MNPRVLTCCLFISLGSLTAMPLAGAQHDGDHHLEATHADNWQLRRLMSPTADELAREARGEVMLYDGLTDKQVDAAMSANFDRIGSMMFLGTIVTDESGEGVPASDGSMTYALEDGGC
jgi:hypothetical protein